MELENFSLTCDKCGSDAYIHVSHQHTPGGGMQYDVTVHCDNKACGSKEEVNL